MIAIIVCGLASVSILPFGKAQTSTTVNGIISSDTTWTQANSPYNLIGNILINNGTTITVGAGTTLNLNGYYIIVNGSLIIQQGVTINMQNATYIQVNGVLSAIGTNDNPVHINGYTELFNIQSVQYARIIFSQDSISWNEQTSSGSIIENAMLNLTSLSVSSSMKLTNNTFLGAGFGISGGSPLINNNIVRGGISITGGSPIISDNSFYSSITCGSSGGGQETGNIQPAVIDDNTISGGAPGAAGISLIGDSLGFNLIIERNLITSNSYAGIDISLYNNVKCTASIINNTITNNAIGIYIVNGYPQPINNNNIHDNTINLKLIENDPADCTNNWWGTTDQQAINQTIYDFKNDFNLGIVNFVPFLTEPNPQATNPTALMSNVSPSPSFSPTSTPITPEFPSIIVVAIALVLVTLAMAAFKEKENKNLKQAIF